MCLKLITETDEIGSVRKLREAGITPVFDEDSSGDPEEDGCLCQIDAERTLAANNCDYEHDPVWNEYYICPKGAQKWWKPDAPAQAGKEDEG